MDIQTITIKASGIKAINSMVENIEKLCTNSEQMHIDGISYTVERVDYDSYKISICKVYDKQTEIVNGVKINT